MYRYLISRPHPRQFQKVKPQGGGVPPPHPLKCDIFITVHRCDIIATHTRCDINATPYRCDIMATPLGSFLWNTKGLA